MTGPKDSGQKAKNTTPARRVPTANMAVDSDADTGMETMDTAMADMAIGQQDAATTTQAVQKRNRSSSPADDRPAKKANLGGDNGDVDEEAGNAVQSVETTGAETSGVKTSEHGTNMPTGTTIADDDEEESLFVPEDRDTRVNNTDDAEADGASANDHDDLDSLFNADDSSHDDGLAELPQIQQTPAKKQRKKKEDKITQEGREKWAAMSPELRALVLEGLEEDEALTILSEFEGGFIIKEMPPRKGDKEQVPKKEVRWLCSDKRKTPMGCHTDVKANAKGPKSHVHKCHKGEDGEEEQTAYGKNQRDPKSAVQRCLLHGEDDCTSKGWPNFHAYHKHLEKDHFKAFGMQSPGEGQTKEELCRRAKLDDTHGPNANWADWVPEANSKAIEPDFGWSPDQPRDMDWAVGKCERMIKHIIQKDRRSRQKKGKKTNDFTPEMNEQINAASEALMGAILSREEEINSETARRLIEDIKVPAGMVDGVIAQPNVDTTVDDSAAELEPDTIMDDSIAEADADAEGEVMDVDDEEAKEGDDDL